MKKLLALFLCSQLFISTVAFADDRDAQDIIKNTQDDIIFIGVAGVSGAVLGLSTLSFVSQPADHLSNIWTGAAIGVIAGVIWVAYDSATKSQEDLESSAHFKTSERVAWHHSQNKILTPSKAQFGTQIWSMSF